MGLRCRQGDRLGVRRRQIDRLPAHRAIRGDDLSGARQMSETASRTGVSRLSGHVLAAAKRFGLSVLPFVVVIAVWQFASLFFPRYLFPSLIDVFWRCLQIFSDGSMFSDVLATIFRILAGLAGAFTIGATLALLMVRSRAVDGFLSPILTLFQGIPALSWVVFAIIWFHGCLLYTSDAADDLLCVDLGGRRIIRKKR